MHVRNGGMQIKSLRETCHVFEGLSVFWSTWRAVQHTVLSLAISTKTGWPRSTSEDSQFWPQLRQALSRLLLS